MELLWVPGETWCWDLWRLTWGHGCSQVTGWGGKVWDTGDGGRTVSISPEKTWDLWVGDARAAWPQLTKALPGP